MKNLGPAPARRKVQILDLEKSYGATLTILALPLPMPIII